MNYKSGIYLITNIVNGKVYVGKDIKLPSRKYIHWSQLKKGVHYNKHLQNAWALYGEQVFYYEVLTYCSIEDLVYWEDWWINFFGGLNSGMVYNLKSADGHEVSEETRAKLSANAGSRRPEVRAKMSASMMGRPSPMKDKKHSADTLAKMSAAQLGKTHTEETKKKIGDRHRGKVVSAETRARQSAATIGKPKPYLKGRPVHSNTTEAHIKALSKNWILTDPDGNEYKITNLYKFCREHNLTPGRLSDLARGVKGRYHHKGWKCQYA